MEKEIIHNIVFIIVGIITFFLGCVYYYNLWKLIKKSKKEYTHWTNYSEGILFAFSFAMVFPPLFPPIGMLIVVINTMDLLKLV